MFITLPTNFVYLKKAPLGYTAKVTQPVQPVENSIEQCFAANIIQLLDETEQNIVIYQWRADQLFADAEGRGK